MSKQTTADPGIVGGGDAGQGRRLRFSLHADSLTLNALQIYVLL